jgi:exopolyphosphatase/guanosine-5'-triphosphate,3'-diphosphate pyrophosphatase
VTRSGQPFAVVDIGSNTVKLYVFVCDNHGEPESIFHHADTVRVGHGIAASGRISDTRAARLVATLQYMEREARSKGATRLFAIATEAFRQVANAEDVQQAVHDQTGWSVDIISGDDETRLTFEAAQSFITEATSTVIADIGGASTEFVVVSAHGVVTAAGSVALGSGSIFDEHVGASPPPPGTLRTATRRSVAILRQSCLLPTSTDHLLLPGGTGHFIQELLAIVDSSAVLDRRSLSILSGFLASQEAAETAELLGIQVQRARVLPAGLAIVEALTAELQPTVARAIPSGIGLGMARRICRNDNIESAHRP